jgi:GNAT superfamily N-acetyltransferase
MIELIRTDSAHPHFVELVSELDAELAVHNGEEHAFYAQFNKITHIGHVVVARMDGYPAGCGAIKSWSEGVAEVKRMYTRPAFRGKGIAKSVLHALEQWALEMNYHYCVLETGIKQTEAIGLYGKSGYQRIPNYGQYEGKENSLCFRKQLTPSG